MKVRNKAFRNMGTYEVADIAILFSDDVDPVGVLAECWSLVWGLVEGYICSINL
jgi:hypothetical protein